MIPKRIHYCWFGYGPMPELAKKCINSWRQLLPDYEIVEWNEERFNLDEFPYARQAYDAKKYAFVTDVVRLYALYSEGGIYMDTDVEVLKPLDDLLRYEAVSGFETTNLIPTGLMASERGCKIVGELLNDYKSRNFVNGDGSLNKTTNVIYITETLKKYGLQLNNKFQTIAGFTFFPSDYLCPKSAKDGKIYLTSNSLVIHHFAGSWHSPWRNKIRNLVVSLGGYKLKKMIRTFVPKKLLDI